MNRENEIEQYVTYLENEIDIIRSFIDQRYSAYNSGEISTDAVELLEDLSAGH